jgi:hypothetical protein
MRKYTLALMAALVLVTVAYVVNRSGTPTSPAPSRVLPNLDGFKLR